MGFKLAFVLGFMLVATATGSYLYIRYLQEQNAVLRGNQVVLESKIAEQNESIKNYLAQQESVAAQLTSMEAEKNAATREFNALRDKFARHDLNDLALSKPGLIQTRVNRGTQRVMDDLVSMTDPDQFDEQDEKSNSDN